LCISSARGQAGQGQVRPESGQGQVKRLNQLPLTRRG
jgi:hypothetical protein